MAKNVGLLGGVRGKLGNAVFYVQNGVQVSRVYQPVVANPNTSLQIAQRAKMALAGRLMGITPAAALAGLPADNVRDRRGLFVRSLVRASTYGNHKAQVAWPDLVLSEGNVAFETNHTVTRTDSSAYVQLVVSTQRNTSDLGFYPGYMERVVVYLIDNTSSGRDICSTRLLTMPTSSAAVATNVNIRVDNGTAANYSAVVYVIPMISSEILGGVNYSWVGTETETYVVIDGLRSNAALSYGRSTVVSVSSSRDDKVGVDMKESKKK